MPTTNEDRGPESWPLASRIFHSYTAMMTILAIAFLPAYLSFALPFPWTIATSTASIVGVVAVIMSLTFHGVKLCERCMAKVPADAQNQANRRKRSFALVHWVFYLPMWKLFLYYFAYLAGTAILWRFLGLPDEWRWTTHIPFDLFLIILWYSYFQHSRYTPWCPYCRRWDDHGPHEQAPTPTPMGEKVT